MVSLGTQPANRKSGFGHSSPTGARAQDLSRQPARPDLWGARVSNDPGLPDLADQHVGGQVIVVVQQDVGFDAAFGAAKLRPGKQAEAQTDGGGIERQQFVLKTGSSPI